MGNKALIVLSGGMDSATALGFARMLHGQDVDTITFNYGSKHNARENFYAKRLCDHYAVPNQLIFLPFVNELFKSDLLKSGGEIPDGHYASPSMKRTVVPFRNAIMLSIATGYAESVGAKKIYIGNHAGDHAIYPDCRTDFIEAFSDAMVLGTYERIELESPFCKFTKTDIVRLGSKLSVPYALTYSCYKGGEKHCGSCGTCYERKEAFRDAGVADPTIYEG